MTDIPIVIDKSGLQPQTPAALRAALLALVSASNPGYTANLPGSLIEDISSTDVGALLVCDNALVELINSLTPYGANAFLLNQLGQLTGVPQGLETNTSVNVIFSGPPGFPISRGFTVSDGTHQYTVQTGVVVNSGGSSGLVFCVATVAGAWSVPANTVTQLITSVPNTISLTVNNPLNGIPSSGAQSEEDYQAQVIQANQAVATGMPTLLKSLLAKVPGVQTRLTSVRQQGAQWEILVGGGDPYQVAFAIYSAVFDTSTLTGSVLSVTGITNASPGVVTTDLTHDYTSGQVVHIDGVLGISGINGTPLIITVLTPHTFSIGVNTTSSGAWTGGGIVTPNLRNQVVSINDYPDTYAIPFVTPPQQTVSIAVLWGTPGSPNLVSATSVAELGAPALAAYVNSIPTGQPMNLYELQNAFQQAVAPLIPTQLLTRMVFTVEVDGNVVNPDAGTGIIRGDAESFFDTNTAMISILPG